MNNSIDVTEHCLHTSNEIATFLKITIQKYKSNDWFLVDPPRFRSLWHEHVPGGGVCTRAVRRHAGMILHVFMLTVARQHDSRPSRECTILAPNQTFCKCSGHYTQRTVLFACAKIVVLRFYDARDPGQFLKV